MPFVKSDAICKHLHYSKMKYTVMLCFLQLFTFYIVSGCPYRRYGDNCDHVCSENCLGQGQCDLISGNCLSGCSDGWVGEQCYQGTHMLCLSSRYHFRRTVTFIFQMFSV